MDRWTDRQTTAHTALAYRGAVKIGWSWTCCFWGMRADRQTDRHADLNTSLIYRGWSKRLIIIQELRCEFRFADVILALKIKRQNLGLFWDHIIKCRRQNTQVNLLTNGCRVRCRAITEYRTIYTPALHKCLVVKMQSEFTQTYTIKLPSAVTLGGAYDGSGASLVGLQGQVICCSGR